MSSKEFPEGWIKLPFKSVVEKIPTNKKKVKQKEYLVTGKFPVIDQGQELIGGYINDEEKRVNCQSPIIVFGDHTKAVKFINFDFVPGADGIKILKPFEAYNPRLFSFFVRVLAKKIPDKGYARHYQHLEKTIIPLPPLPEQHQIVARLEELFSDLEDGIVSLKKAQEQLKTYRQAVLKYAFEGKLTAEWRKQHQPESAETLLKQIKTERERQYQSKLDEWQQTCEQATAAGKKKPPKPKKPKDLPPLTEAELAELPELPKGWCWVKLGAIINDGPSNGYSPRSGKDAKGTKSLKLTATTSRKLILNDSTIKWLYEKIDENSKYWLKDGDILIQRANTLEYLGATAIYKGKPNEYIYPDLMMRIRIKNDIMTRYTWHFCNSLFGRIYFRSNATGIAGNMPKISGATLINLLIPIPNIKEQHQIVQEIESRLSVCDQLEQTIADSLQKAESLRQSILKQAFEGKLTEPWRKTHPNLISGEHSAAALLERIRTEKEKLTSKKQ